MAHKGKLFPVLFRRDWNYDVTSNDDGFANRYIVNLNIATTGPGSFAKQVPYDCGPATNRFVSEMHWLSQVFHFGIFDFQVEMESDIDQARQLYVQEIRLAELHVGVIARWPAPASGTRLPGFPPAFPDPMTYYDPLWFDTYPYMQFSQVRPKYWSDGPPH